MNSGKAPLGRSLSHRLTSLELSLLLLLNAHLLISDRLTNEGKAKSPIAMINIADFCAPVLPCMNRGGESPDEPTLAATQR